MERGIPNSARNLKQQADEVKWSASVAMNKGYEGNATNGKTNKRRRTGVVECIEGPSEFCKVLAESDSLNVEKDKCDEYVEADGAEIDCFPATRPVLRIKESVIHVLSVHGHGIFDTYQGIVRVAGWGWMKNEFTRIMAVLLAELDPLHENILFVITRTTYYLRVKMFQREPPAAGRLGLARYPWLDSCSVMWRIRGSEKFKSRRW